METTKRDQFANLDVIPGTLVNFERLFSLAKNTLTDTWKCTAPVLFEALLLYAMCHVSMYSARNAFNTYCCTVTVSMYR